MVQISRFPVGTRVRIRRGLAPLDPAFLGRSGLVLRHDPSIPTKVGVQLDGESHIHTFQDDELEREG
jgi:hypothetical protein